MKKALVIWTSCCGLSSSPALSSPLGAPIRNVPASTRTNFMPTLLLNDRPADETVRSTPASGSAAAGDGPAGRAASATSRALRQVTTPDRRDGGMITPAEGRRDP